MHYLFDFAFVLVANNILDIKRQLEKLTFKFDKAMSQLIEEEKPETPLLFPINTEKQLWDIEHKLQSDPEFSENVVCI